jgi:hypothetical protein
MLNVAAYSIPILVMAAAIFYALFKRFGGKAGSGSKKVGILSALI